MMNPPAAKTVKLTPPPDAVTKKPRQFHIQLLPVYVFLSATVAGPLLLNDWPRLFSLLLAKWIPMDWAMIMAGIFHLFLVLLVVFFGPLVRRAWERV